VVLAAFFARQGRVDDAIGQGVQVQTPLPALFTGGRIGDFLLNRQRALNVFDGEHQMRLASDGHAVGEPARLPAHRLDDVVAAGRDRVGAQVHQLLGHDVDGGEKAEREVEDRKSTRLNSSHVKISYAVFCLKKKKNSSIVRS